MKWKMLAFIILAGALAVASGVQSQPNQVKKDPLFFVKIAAGIADNVQHETVNGALAIYLDDQHWAAGLKDSDLGPFLKVKEAKPGRSATCLFRESKDSAVCVYFDGDSAFGVAAVKAGAGGKIEASNIAAAYKPITKEMLKKGTEALTFTPGDISTDDGQPLPAFVVATTAKSKS